MFKFHFKIYFLIIFLIFICSCSNTDTTEPVRPAETLVPPLNTPTLPAQAVLPTPSLPPPLPTELPTPQAVLASSTWLKTYGGRQDDTVEALLLAEDGDFYLAGSTNSQVDSGGLGETYLLRTDSAGEILWEQTYPDYGSAQAIRLSSDGGLLVSGVTLSPQGDNTDIFLLEVDQDGNELWSKTFGGPLDEYGAAWPMEDGGYILGGIVVDPEDIVVDDPGVAGYGGFSGRSNIYLAHLDADGNELWSQTLGGEDNAMTAGGLMTADGGFLILANILNYPQYDDDIILLKIDQNGNEVWSRTWEQGNLDGNALIQTSDGNYLIAGGYADGGETDMAQKDFMFIKVNPDGEEIWQSVFGDPEVYDWAYGVTEVSTGGFVAVGDFSRDMYTWDSDIVLIEIDENGQLIWQQTIDTNTHTMLRGVLEHPQGGYVITGTTYRRSNLDILLIRTDAEGKLDQ